MIVYLDRKGINKDIACRQRFFYELTARSATVSLPTRSGNALALERQNFWNTRTQANRATHPSPPRTQADRRKRRRYVLVVTRLGQGLYDRKYHRTAPFIDVLERELTADRVPEIP